MSEAPRYTVFFTPAARRRLDKLLLPAATALYERLTGPVAENPYRLGNPWMRHLMTSGTTRRGDYRAVYTIDDRERVVTVLAVAHRRDAYRP
jgi:mRNA-degrading endonuclease RelE of RelBE toxin-antitoxin system